MNYIGSKKSLLPFLDKNIYEISKYKEGNTFCDLFAGTGVVGSYFKNKNLKIISNDLQYYSYVTNKALISVSQELNFKGLDNDNKNTNLLQDKILNVLSYLNNIKPKEGFIYNNYCPGGTNSSDFIRQYFTDENGKKCDAIRIQIEEWRLDNLINENEYFYLLAILLEAIDKVANTASVYGAFLKSFKKSSLKTLELKPLEIIKSEYDNKVYHQDANELIREIKGKILYLDPPYNSRQYSPNYHVLETISLYDKPILKGKTGLRDYSHQKSKYSIKKETLNTFQDLINEANFEYIFLSYNNEGILNLQEIQDTMKKRGEYQLISKEYQRFKADNNREHSANKVTEYLHVLKVK